MDAEDSEELFEEEEVDACVLPVRLAVPADLPARWRLTVVDSDPAAFRATGEGRLLGVEVGSEEGEWCPHLDPGEFEAGELELSERGWVQRELWIDWLPAGRPLWLCTTVWDGKRFVAPGEGVPRVIEIAPLAPERLDDPLPVRLPRPRWGALRGSLSAAPQFEGYGIQLGFEDEAPGRIDKEGSAFVHGFLSPGPRTMDLLVDTDDAWIRRVQRIDVPAGAVLELEAFELEAAPLRWTLAATDPEGDALNGRFVFEFECLPELPSLQQGERELELWGDWRDLTAVRFEPGRAEDFGAARVTARGFGAGRIELVAQPLEAPSTSLYAHCLLPGGERREEPLLAFARRPGELTWRQATLGFRVGCVNYAPDLIEVGPLEVLAWSPLQGLFARDRIAVEDSAPWIQEVGLALRDPRTRLRGELRLTLAGHELGEAVWIAAVPRGSERGQLARQLGRFDAWLDSGRSPVRFHPGPFELAGLPPFVDLELVVLDAAGAELHVRPLRLIEGQVLDLGSLEIELR